MAFPPPRGNNPHHQQQQQQQQQQHGYHHMVNPQQPGFHMSQNENEAWASMQMQSMSRAGMGYPPQGHQINSQSPGPGERMQYHQMPMSSASPGPHAGMQYGQKSMNSPAPSPQQMMQNSYQQAPSPMEQSLPSPHGRQYQQGRGPLDTPSPVLPYPADARQIDAQSPIPQPDMTFPTPQSLDEPSPGSQPSMEVLQNFSNMFDMRFGDGLMGYGGMQSVGRQMPLLPVMHQSGMPQQNVFSYADLMPDNGDEPPNPSSKAGAAATSSNDAGHDSLSREMFAKAVEKGMATKDSRYRNTMNALEKAGLLDITLQTSDLMKRNSTLQKDLDMLEEIVKVTKHLMNDA